MELAQTSTLTHGLGLNIAHPSTHPPTHPRPQCFARMRSILGPGLGDKGNLIEKDFLLIKGGGETADWSTGQRRGARVPVFIFRKDKQRMLLACPSVCARSPSVHACRTSQGCPAFPQRNISKIATTNQTECKSAL